jgi:hypothetical protein
LPKSPALSVPALVGWSYSGKPASTKASILSRNANAIAGMKSLFAGKACAVAIREAADA